MSFVQHYTNTKGGDLRCAFSILEQHQYDAKNTCLLELKQENDAVSLIDGTSVATSSDEFRLDCGEGRLSHAGEQAVKTLRPGCRIKSRGVLVYGRNVTKGSGERVIERDFPSGVVKFIEEGGELAALRVRALSPVTLATLERTSFLAETEKISDDRLIHDFLVIFFLAAFVSFVCLVGAALVRILQPVFSVLCRRGNQVAVHNDLA